MQKGIMKKIYPSDLNDKEWALIASFYEERQGKRGRPPSKNLRAIWNAKLYIVRSGCSWRMLPKEFPPWKTVYNYFQRIKKNGLLERILSELNKMVRVKIGKEATPSVGIVDSQSVKSRSIKKSG